MNSNDIDEVLSPGFNFETELTKGQQWTIPATHDLISKIKGIMMANQNTTTLRDAFIMAYNIAKTKDSFPQINFDNYDIVFYTDAVPNRSRGQSKYNQLDLACYKWGFISRTYDLRIEMGGGGLNLILTITPVVKKQATLPQIGNEEMITKQKEIIEEMTKHGLFAKSTYPAPDLVRNVVKLAHSDFFVVETVIGVCDGQHDFRHGWRGGPIITNSNGSDTNRSKRFGRGKSEDVANHVCKLLDTQYKKLKYEANQFIQNDPVFEDEGTLGHIWHHKSNIEPAIFEKLMPKNDGNTNAAMKTYNDAWNRSHENEYTSHINAPSYPKYHEPTVFNNTFNDSCKFIMPASAIDGATCGRCGNWKKVLQGCPMEIGNINITFMKTLMNGSDDPTNSNYVNFSSYMTNDADGVYYFLRITRQRTLPGPGGTKTYIGYYKYKIMDSENNPDALTVVTVNSELGCYYIDEDGTIDGDLMKMNNMLPMEPGVNERTLGEYVNQFAHGKLATNVNDDFDWVHIVRKASCDFLFSLTTFLQTGGYYGDIYSSDNVISPNIANPTDFNVTVAHGDQAAAALGYFILRKCKNKNVNKGLHQYYATDNSNLRFGNINGICIRADNLGKRGNMDDEDKANKKKKKGGGGPFVGPSWARVPRFDNKIDTHFEMIKAFFEGCAQFNYPVVLLICYNEVKTDSPTLDNFLLYTVRKLDNYEYQPKTRLNFGNNEEELKNIIQLVRTKRDAYDNIKQSYENLVKEQDAAAAEAKEAAAAKAAAAVVVEAAAKAAEEAAAGEAKAAAKAVAEAVVEAAAEAAEVKAVVKAVVEAAAKAAAKAAAGEAAAAAKAVVDEVVEAAAEEAAVNELLSRDDLLRLVADILKHNTSPSASASPSASPSASSGVFTPPPTTSDVLSEWPTPLQAKDPLPGQSKDPLNGGSSTRTRRRRKLHRNHRRTQYTNKHKRSSKTTNRATIKHRKSYRKHNRTVKRRKSRRHH
jgi:hypothetical protein